MKINLKAIATIAGLAALAALVPVKVSAQSDSSDDRFKKGEFDVSPFATYVDKAGGKWGAGTAVTYFPLEYLGVGGSTYWTEGGGTLFDNAAAEGYFRLPILKSLAPYAVGSVGYQFDRQYWFNTLGAGLDFRPLKEISAFSDVQYRFAGSGFQDGVFLRLGIRLDF